MLALALALVAAILVVSGAALALGALAAIERRGRERSAEHPSPRPERLARFLLAGLGAGPSFTAAAVANSDASLELGGGIVLVFAVVGLAALAIAIEAARFGPLLRPTRGGIVGALAGAAVYLASSPVLLAESACACARPAVPYIPPAFLGLTAPGWALVALIATPALSLAAVTGRR
jgi:hypothetical protein